MEFAGVYISFLFWLKNKTRGPMVLSCSPKYLVYTEMQSKILRSDLNLRYSLSFIYSFSWLHLPALWSQAAIVSEKSIIFLFSVQKHVRQNLTWGKIGQGQPTIIIPTNYEQPVIHMLHTNFQPIGSTEDFLKRFSICSCMGMAAIFVNWTRLHFHVLKSFHLKFGFKWLSSFWEK